VPDLLIGLWRAWCLWVRTFRFRLRGHLEFEVEYQPLEDLPTDPADD
jgi:hypothetical protein